MNKLDLTVQSREGTKSSGNRRALREGRLPSVIYGGGGEHTPRPVYLDRVEFEKLTAQIHTATIFNLKVDDGKSERAIIKMLQRDPVTDRVIHIDFIRVTDKPVVIRVPVVSVGIAPGTRRGGRLSPIERSLMVRCKPDDMPDKIEVNVTKLDLGGMIRVGDLTPPPGVEFTAPPRLVLFTMTTARGMKEEAETPGDAPDAAAGADKAAAKPAGKSA